MSNIRLIAHIYIVLKDKLEDKFQDNLKTFALGAF